jgi:hypothetical protein
MSSNLTISGKSAAHFLACQNIDVIRAACNGLPGAPNLERDIKALERIRWEVETLRTKARELEERAAEQFADELRSEWSDDEIRDATRQA